MGPREHPNVTAAVKHYLRINKHGYVSINVMAREYDVPRSTLSKALKRHKAKQ